MTTTLTNSLQQFIKQQVDLGNAKSELEAELIIVKELQEKELDRKLTKAQNQVKNGKYQKFDDDYISSFLNKARKRNVNNI